MQKIKLGLLFGGRSCEHEISVLSAQSILRAVDRAQCQVALIGIDAAGRWRVGADMDALLRGGKVKPVAARDRVTIAAHPGGNLIYVNPRPGAKKLPAPEIFFPALHGSFGEDGTVQGLLELAGRPYVGCGVAASAVAMDKLLAKKIFRAAGLPQTDYLPCAAHTLRDNAAAVVARAEEKLGYPLFVKPANMGSSVGIRKVHTRAELKTALQYALQFDAAAVMERALENCMEAECAILGNRRAQASVVGEIRPGAEFYDYRAKYLANTAEYIVPADLPAATAARVQELSLAAYRAIGGAGLARADFFIHRDSGEVTLNEINTMPGFTPISMYPRLWAASGVPYAELIHRLLTLARKRHAENESLRRVFDRGGAARAAR